MNKRVRVVMYGERGIGRSFLLPEHAVELARESKSKRWARKRKARIERDRELGVERRPHPETCLVHDTSGGVCDCGENQRRAAQRSKYEQGM